MMPSLVQSAQIPADLDEAVLDRMDEVIAFPLPDAPARAALGRQYFDALVAGAARPAAPATPKPCTAVTCARAPRAPPPPPLLRLAPCVTAAALDAACHAADGLSGRHLAKLFRKVRAEAQGGGGGLVTAAMICRCVDEERAALQLRAPQPTA